MIRVRGDLDSRERSKSPKRPRLEGDDFRSSRRSTSRGRSKSPNRSHNRRGSRSRSRRSSRRRDKREREHRRRSRSEKRRHSSDERTKQNEDRNVKETNKTEEEPKAKKEPLDLLRTRTGGAYIPPAKLRMMQDQIVTRGLLVRSIMQAQAFSPVFSHVYAAFVAVINSKFPHIGELLLRRLIVPVQALISKE
ncbi:hypothetical protein KIN20_015737 [Parelaphostrongylus tenuis]|uniref:Uncharacterized protein n=1 Tax=Parelaphostrongylus tenuis TaxID=148309 RepID=A0AAD5MIY9_PARTN|nr:hypothetical protein KIN20_015737 [Parelaphostrongylus tenuis]